MEDTTDERARVSPYKIIGDENSYTTDYLTAKAIEFITKKRKKPFFLMISYPDHHPPYFVRHPYDKMFKPKQMPIPSTFYQTDRTAWIGVKKKIKARNLKKIKAQYCGEVKCIDDNVGKILMSLRKKENY